MSDLRAQLIDPILAREGGWVDRAADRGGPTNWGVTLATLRSYYHDPSLGPDDLRALTRDAARDILWFDFIQKPGIDRIPNEKVMAEVADGAVNHGPDESIKLLQRALRVADDGVIGPATLTAIPYLDPEKLLTRLRAQRLRLYSQIARKNKLDNDHDGIPDQLENLPGWIDRMADVMEAAAA